MADLIPTHASSRPALFSKPKRARRTPEQILHRQIAQFLDVALAGDAYWSTIPLGGGGRLRGAILKGVGVKAGMPDAMVLDGGRAIFFEIKTYTGAVSAAQKKCHVALRRAGCAVYVVRSLDDVMIALRESGVPMRVAE